MRVLNARVLDLRAVLDQIFDEEPLLPAAIDHLEFIQRHYSEVYRLRAAGRSYIAHVTPDSSEYLRRVRDRLRQLTALQESGIPQVLGWRDETSSAPLLGSQWAVLVCNEIPGAELGPSTYTSGVWANLSQLLQRVHSLPANGAAEDAISRPIHQPEAFGAFAEMLLLRLHGLPLRRERVSRHLNAMAKYVSDNRTSFRIQPRLIHGDLNRSNVLVAGENAGIIDWSELGAGDYAYDLAMLKFMMDSVAPRQSADLLRKQVLRYRDHFADSTLELRMRFFLALSGLVHAFWYASQPALFPAARAWRVRICYLHSEAQWASPLRLDGSRGGAPAARTEHWALHLPQPLRGVFYLLAPKRVT